MSDEDEYYDQRLGRWVRRRPSVTFRRGSTRNGKLAVMGSFGAGMLFYLFGGMMGIFVAYMLFAIGAFALLMTIISAIGDRAGF